jgi:4-amino-4-deoxy-L-arabinose transferase-like glycosyltransferase
MLATIASILLFDIKVSLSGDDCDYIVAAGEFWKNFTYPGHHGPLYPIILSPFVGIFGIKLILLKILSVIFIVASLRLFYKSFRHIVPAIIRIPTLLLVSINPYVLFFASYTYSEPLFMFMQALFFYLFSKYFWNNNAEYSLKNAEYSLKKDWSKYLLLALAIMGMGLTRTIGFCVVGVIILYFILERRWKDLVYTVSIFTIVFGIFYILKPIIWPDSSSVQSFETLLAKNPYNPEQGPEDFSGIIQRLIDNSNIYLSGFLYKYFGFRSSSDIPLKDIPVLSILTYILFITCFAAVFRKSKPLVFTGLYAGILIFANFILLHKLWSQDRIIMVYYPLVLLFLTGGFYCIFNRKAFKNISFLLFALFLVSLSIGTGIHAKNRISKNLPALQQYLLGNDLYGLTPDWENFVKMSRWANVNLDKDAVIASRKPTISYVYTDRYFYGIYNVPYVNIHEITEQNQADKDNHVFLTVEMGANQRMLNNLAPLLQYIFISKQGASFSINGKEIKSAVLYKIEKSLFNEDLINFLNEHNFNYTPDYDSFLKQYIEDRNVGYQIVDPDVLLQNIKDNNIRYLILAKIRLYTSQNTGLFINTVHQYITFIQLKYPNRFKLIHTIGKEETCELAEFTGE